MTAASDASPESRAEVAVGAGPGASLGCPPPVREALGRARRLEWWSLFWFATIIAVVGLVMGERQAMRTAWIEDCLSLLPPILFLSPERRPAMPRFPYGFHRTASLAFFAAAAALLAFGAIFLREAAAMLVRREHPVIGSLAVAGQEVCLGWLMIPALAYSVVPPVIQGRLKQRPAETLHD